MAVNSFREHPLKPKRAFDPHFTFQEKRYLVTSCRGNPYSRGCGYADLGECTQHSAKAQCECR